MTGAELNATTWPAPSAFRARSAVSFGVGKLPVVGPASKKSARTSSSMASDTEAFIVAPNMPMAVTRATPNIKAKAVAAVRRGLRAEFVAASLPTAPKGAPTTRPIEGTIGSEIAGPARKKPTMRFNAPRPTREARMPVETSRSTPKTAKIMPAMSSNAPRTVRTRREEPAADSVVRIASTGSTAPARRAGAHAEITVTIVPRMSGTTTALTLRPRPPPIGMSCAEKTALMAATRPTPATTPTAEPTRPTMMASVTTERVIWPREAPSARSNANSLVR